MAGVNYVLRPGRVAVPRADERTSALLDAATVVPVFAFAAVGGLALTDGGYFPTTWGWSALGFSWVVAMALVFRREIAFRRMELAWFGALAALVAWIAASIAWTDDLTQTVLETERAIVYVAAAGALLLVVRGCSVARLLGGVLGAIAVVSAYALATRLFPDRLGVYDPIGGYRLSEPLGYWNALGLLAAIGIALALGFAARAGTIRMRALAAGLLPLLSVTLYFTFGRGTWIALALALLVAVAIDPRRLQSLALLFAVAPASALAVWLAARSDALTHEALKLEEAVRDGQVLAVAVVVLAFSSACVAAAFAVLESRVEVRRAMRMAFAAVVAGAAVVALVAAVDRYGSPPTLVTRAADAFRNPVVATDGDLNKRLFSLSGTGRAQFWKVAWGSFEDAPVVGSGAGTWEQRWYRDRPITFAARDAHSLYLEVLAELGPLGLALVLMLVGVPLAAGVRARRNPYVPAATAAFAAYVVHAAIDWDWEMPALTIAAFAAAVALLAAGRASSREVRLTRGARAAGIAAACAVAVLSLATVSGNSALAASITAADEGDSRGARSEALKAAQWAPWSSQPWQRLGEAHALEGSSVAARRAFREALAKDSGNWFLWYELALVSHGSERTRAAAVALRLNPLDADVRRLNDPTPRR